ncbi:MAG: DUF4153 domain-containing protein [Acidimicrobiales bacterium]
MAAGAILAAFFTNLGLQTSLHSIATLLATVAVVALVLGVRSRRRLSVYGPSALAVASAMVMAFRTSPWVTLPAFGVLLMSLAVAGQNGLLARSGIVTTARRFVVDVVDSVPWLVRPLLLANRGRTGNARIIRGSLLAVLAVVPLAALLASADPIFGGMLTSALSQGFWTHMAATILLLPAIAGLALAARRPDQREHSALGGENSGAPKPGSMVEGTIILSSVAALLGAWGLTQIVVALGGADRLMATADLTAAQNVRQGFFQLVAATALIVAVMVAIDRFVARTTAAERLRFGVLTSLIGVETIGVVVATYGRLSLYIQGFGYTMLRTAVAWFLAWLVVVMAALIVTMNYRKLSNQPLGGMLFMLAGLWVVAFGAFNPEGFVAAGNLDQQTAAGLDGRYLVEGLGADAVPAIVDRIPAQAPSVQAQLTASLCMRTDLYSDTGLFGWNASLSQAQAAIAGLEC